MVIMSISELMGVIGAMQVKLYSGLVSVEDDGESEIVPGRRMGKQLDPAWLASRAARPKLSDLWQPEANKVRIWPAQRAWVPDLISSADVAASMLR